MGAAAPEGAREPFGSFCEVTGGGGVGNYVGAAVVVATAHCKAGAAWSYQSQQLLQLHAPPALEIDCISGASQEVVGQARSDGQQQQQHYNGSSARIAAGRRGA